MKRMGTTGQHMRNTLKNLCEESHEPGFATSRLWACAMLMGSGFIDKLEVA